MPASLIKIVTSTSIREFTPAAVVKIEYQVGASKLDIVLQGLVVVTLQLQSAAEALIKLGQLETAMSSGTGIATINETPTVTTTTSTTTAAPTTTTTTSPVEPPG
jgi:hypothetical protein